MNIILLISYNYSPEPIGIGKYSGELGAYLSAQGNRVEVLTAYPYYPQWKVQASYRAYRFQKELMHGQILWRCPILIPSHPKGWKRLLPDASFLLSAWMMISLLLLKRKKYDLVFVVAPGFLNGLLGLWYRLWRPKTRLWYHVQDLQVDAAREMDMLPRWLTQFLLGLERWMMRKMDSLSTISEGMRLKIKAKGLGNRQVELFPNWVDTQKVVPLPSGESFRAEWGFSPDDFIVMYAGNLGEKQGLDLLIRVAATLQDLEKLHFLICGEGAAAASFKKQASGLKNVQFYPLQPEAALSRLLATADIHLVLQKGAASDLVMPSKLGAICATGGCAMVTASAGSYLYQIISENNLGLLIQPESEPALRAAILSALTMNLEDYRKSARLYAIRCLSKLHILKEFEQKIKAL